VTDEGRCKGRHGRFGRWDKDGEGNGRGIWLADLIDGCWRLESKHLEEGGRVARVLSRKVLS
jgi:hypothetical protein